MRKSNPTTDFALRGAWEIGRFVVQRIIKVVKSASEGGGHSGPSVVGWHIRRGAPGSVRFWMIMASNLNNPAAVTSGDVPGSYDPDCATCPSWM